MSTRNTRRVHTNDRDIVIAALNSVIAEIKRGALVRSVSWKRGRETDHNIEWVLCAKNGRIAVNRLSIKLSPPKPRRAPRAEEPVC